MECSVCVSSFIITVGGISQNNTIYFTMVHEFGFPFLHIESIIFSFDSRSNALLGNITV